MEISSRKISALLQPLTTKLISSCHFWRQNLSLHYCDLCLQRSHHYSLLCQQCSTDLIRFDLIACHGNLLLYPNIARQLPQIKFSKLICLAPYQWPFNAWISQMKYQHRFEVATLLAQLLASHIKQSINNHELPQLIISVPLHPQRLKSRQFNQAALIAFELAKKLSVNYQSHLITRVLNTDPQVGQSGASRRKNLKHAFSLNSNTNANNNGCLPEHVAIVDDVLTTGATVSEMAKLLTTHGVKKITVLCVCLAMKN